MQILHSPHRTVFSCAKSVYATEGLAAFCVSYPTTLTMSVPFTAVQFSVYESLKTLLNPDGTYSPITHVIAGGFAGGVAAAVTTPLDVAKVSLQAQSHALYFGLSCKRPYCRPEEVRMTPEYDKHEAWQRHYGSSEIEMVCGDYGEGCCRGC